MFSQLSFHLALELAPISAIFKVKPELQTPDSKETFIICLAVKFYVFRDASAIISLALMPFGQAAWYFMFYGLRIFCDVCEILICSAKNSFYFTALSNFWKPITDFVEKKTFSYSIIQRKILKMLLLLSAIKPKFFNYVQLLNKISTQTRSQKFCHDIFSQIWFGLLFQQVAQESYFYS